MKKILLSILLIFMAVGMVGCGEEEINYIDIEATDVDMSVYDGMNSLNHHFKSITPTELLRVYNEGGSGIFYIGYSGCHNCQDAVKYIEEAAANNDVTVYYMDCYNPYDPLSEHVDEFIETFKESSSIARRVSEATPYDLCFFISQSAFNNFPDFVCNS